MILATKLYVEFLGDESRLPSAYQDNSQFEGSGFGEEDATGFLTGSELDGEARDFHRAMKPRLNVAVEPSLRPICGMCTTNGTMRLMIIAPIGVSFGKLRYKMMKVRSSPKPL